MGDGCVCVQAEEGIRDLVRYRGLGDVYKRQGEEKARAFLEWAESFPDTPPLSDDAISRASMYPDLSLIHI